MEKGMNMQDKEFDDLFRSGLDNFEAEPSAQVWQNIDAGLSGRKNGKGITFILGIAASIIVLITAGILFIPKQEATKHNKPASNSLVINKVKSTKEIPGNTLATLVKKEDQIADAHIPVKQVVSTRQHKATIVPVAKREQNILAASKEQIAQPDEQPILAASATQNTNEVQPQVPVKLEAISATVKQVNDNSAISLPAQPLLASTELPAKTIKPTTKKHGIRNFGDLVNLVVAKVDKRKDKVIEFTDNDDDESTITGVHLGAIRIKKDN